MAVIKYTHPTLAGGFSHVGLTNAVSLLDWIRANALGITTHKTTAFEEIQVPRMVILGGTTGLDAGRCTNPTSQIGICTPQSESKTFHIPI
jgi:hypothetical protein